MKDVDADKAEAPTNVEPPSKKCWADMSDSDEDLKLISATVAQPIETESEVVKPTKHHKRMGSMSSASGSRMERKGSAKPKIIDSGRPYRVHVANLPKFCYEADIYKVFDSLQVRISISDNTWVQVIAVDLPGQMDHNPFGFVEVRDRFRYILCQFSTFADYKRALLEFDNHVLKGRRLSVQIARKPYSGSSRARLQHDRGWSEQDGNNRRDDGFHNRRRNDTYQRRGGEGFRDSTYGLASRPSGFKGGSNAAVQQSDRAGQWVSPRGTRPIGDAGRSPVMGPRAPKPSGFGNNWAQSPQQPHSAEKKQDDVRAAGSGGQIARPKVNLRGSSDDNEARNPSIFGTGRPRQEKASNRTNGPSETNQAVTTTDIIQTSGVKATDTNKSNVTPGSAVNSPQMIGSPTAQIVIAPHNPTLGAVAPPMASPGEPATLGSATTLDAASGTTPISCGGHPLVQSHITPPNGQLAGLYPANSDLQQWGYLQQQQAIYPGSQNISNHSSAYTLQQSNSYTNADHISRFDGTSYHPGSAVHPSGAGSGGGYSSNPEAYGPNAYSQSNYHPIGFNPLDIPYSGHPSAFAGAPSYYGMKGPPSLYGSNASQPGVPRVCGSNASQPPSNIPAHPYASNGHPSGFSGPSSSGDGGTYAAGYRTQQQPDYRPTQFSTATNGGQHTASGYPNFISQGYPGGAVYYDQSQMVVWDQIYGHTPPVYDHPVVPPRPYSPSYVIDGRAIAVPPAEVVTMPNVYLPGVSIPTRSKLSDAAPSERSSTGPTILNSQFDGFAPLHD